MSFGWSAGDIVAVITLTTKIIGSLRNVGGARDNFQQLESELEDLRYTLNEVSTLSNVPGQIPEILALKSVSCLCEDSLRRFYSKINPFEQSLGNSSKIPKRRAALRMVRWEILTKKDIPEFRSYLVAHVGSLNLRLSTASLKLSAKLYTASHANHKEHETSLESIRQHLRTQTLAIHEKINLISNSDTVPILDSLHAMASNVWKTHNEMIDMLTKALDKPQTPDLHHTWAQAPIRFEDALGRVIPVPSEYDWEMFEAIIHTRFKESPGHAKVHSKEYELYFFGVNVKPMRAAGYHPTPGMWITMTFVVGQYVGSERCPRVGCTSREFVFLSGGAKKCSLCQGWFLKSQKELPRPMRPHVAWKEDAAPYEDRQFYKHVSLYITKLPPTPQQFRDKYHRGYINPKLAALYRKKLGMPSLPEPGPMGEVKPDAANFQAFNSVQTFAGPPPSLQPQHSSSFWGLPPQVTFPGPDNITQTSQMRYVHPSTATPFYPITTPPARFTSFMGMNSGANPYTTMYATPYANPHPSLQIYSQRNPYSNPYSRRL